MDLVTSAYLILDWQMKPYLSRLFLLRVTLIYMTAETALKFVARKKRIHGHMWCLYRINRYVIIIIDLFGFEMMKRSEL